MRCSSPLALTAAILLCAAAQGCNSSLGGNSTLSQLHQKSGPASREIQPVSYRPQPAEESVVLEAEPPQDRTPANWQRLLNPFQKSQRIPLPLSPKSASGDSLPDNTGF